VVSTREEVVSPPEEEKEVVVQLEVEQYKCGERSSLLTQISQLEDRVQSLVNTIGTLKQAQVQHESDLVEAKAEAFYQLRAAYGPDSPRTRRAAELQIRCSEFEQAHALMCRRYESVCKIVRVSKKRFKKLAELVPEPVSADQVAPIAKILKILSKDLPSELLVTEDERNSIFKPLERGSGVAAASAASAPPSEGEFPSPNEFGESPAKIIFAGPEAPPSKRKGKDLFALSK